MAESAHARWLEQLNAMREAIAELKLPESTDNALPYGHDLDFDDDDFSGTASGEDIWDVISDEYEDGYSSDLLEPASGTAYAESLYSQDWLAQKCAEVAQQSSGLDAGALAEQITAILASDSNGTYLQRILSYS